MSPTDQPTPAADDAETDAHDPAHDPALGPAGSDMLLTFQLQGETFALSVDHVHEILDPLPQTRVPNADPFAPALVNVRGTVVPLVDVRHRLGMPPAPAGGDSRTVVLEVAIAGETTKLAFLADAVDEVVDGDRVRLEPIPELGARWPAAVVLGVARHRGGLVVILNTDTLFRPGGALTTAA